MISSSSRGDRLTPQEAEIRFALARAHRREEAIAVYGDLLRQVPGHVDSLNNMSVLLRLEGRLDGAEGHARAAAEARPDDIELWSNLGQILADQGRHDEAATTFQRVIEEAPENAEGYRKMTTLFQKMGEFERSRMVLARAWELGLDDPELLQLQSLDGGSAFPEAARELAEELGQAGKCDPEAAATARFALSVADERIGEHAAAFKHLAAANRLVAKQVKYRAAEHDGYFDALEQVFDADFFAGVAGGGSGSEQPVFVLGMPRSGTTLAEQIIASHSAATAAGELGAMQDIEQDLPRLLGGEGYPRCLEGLGAEQAPQLTRDLAERYLARLRRAGMPGGGEVARITDKMPPNFLRLGLIAALLPKARVVHCRRSAMATCFSIYQQRFAAPLDFAYDLRSIAHYYGRYDRLMAHWRAVCPLPIHEVAYEDLIADPEGQARALIAAAGLDWEDGCLRFHESAQAVNTASLWQVRQPVYDSSLEKWRAYEDQLVPLRDALAAAGVDPDS